MTDFQGVVEAWRKADPTHIHPLRNVSEDDYWESGRSQALQAAQWIPEGGTVLDFGCGDGRLSIPLAKLGFEVYAVDASPEMLDRLRKNAEEQSVPVSEFYGDATPVYPMVWDGTYPWELDADAVVCRAVLIHHSHKDVETIVGNLAACLKPGGVFIADWPLGPHHERRDWIDVTTWELAERQKVADANGLSLINDGTVWRKE